MRRFRTVDYVDCVHLGLYLDIFVFDSVNVYVTISVFEWYAKLLLQYWYKLLNIADCCTLYISRNIA
jgi:lipoprotein signal peptidase